MTVDDYAKSLLAIVIWREARGDGLDAMRAVAHVISNRAYKWHHGDFINTITSPNQFSSMTIRGDSQTVLWPNDTVTEQELFNLVESVFSGSDVDNTNGALFYAREDEDLLKSSPWYVHNIISNPKHPIVAKIGTQTFRA